MSALPGRLEGPLSAALYIVSSLLMTSMTKYAASVWRFPGSSFMLLVECVVTAVGMAAIGGRGKYQPFSGPILRHLPLVTLSKAANMYLSFLAMKHVSIPVYNVLKRLQPIYTMVQDRLLRGARAGPWDQAGVALMSLGTLVIGVGDLDFDWLGYLVAVVAAGSQSLYLVLAQRATDALPSLTSSDLLFYTAFYNSVVFVPLAAAEAVEITAFLGRPGEIWNFFLFITPYMTLGAALNFVTFWCTKANSPLATAVAGALKGVCIIVAGLLLFETHLTPLGWLGLVLNSLGGFVYSIGQTMGGKKRH